jgi:hypothetical protein
VGADVFGEGASVIKGMQRAVARHSFGATGAGSVPARRTHDAISSAVYAAVRGAGRAAGAAAGLAPAAARTHDLSRSSASTATVGAINGLIGDRLEAEDGAGIRDLCLTCDAPPYEGAGAHYACATITAQAGNPVGWAVGDLLVCQAGGSPEARHLGARHHFHLLNDPEVYEAAIGWLS